MEKEDTISVQWAQEDVEKSYNLLNNNSTNICTEYFKRGMYSPFFSSSKCSLFHNSNVFGSRIIHILYTGCAKIKKIIPAPKV
jgi:hypothetical protein